MNNLAKVGLAVGIALVVIGRLNRQDEPLADEEEQVGEELIKDALE